MPKKPVHNLDISALLYHDGTISIEGQEYLLAISFLLMSQSNSDNGRPLIKEFAYYIILRTALKTGDYRALFDFSVEFGYYPIIRKILDLKLIPEKQITLSMINVDFAVNTFKRHGRVVTIEQYNTWRRLSNEEYQRTAVIAPTSYGKSELIYDLISENPSHFSVIIVPTKALVAQVSKDVKERFTTHMVISNDQDITKVNLPIIAVVTQERAIRLLTEGAIFDVMYVDEAQELLGFDFRQRRSNRSLLLSRVIRLARQVNPKIKEYYFSPTISEASSLEIDQLPLFEHKISHDMKVLDVKFLSHNGELEQYDRYLGRFYPLKTIHSWLDYMLTTKKDKNLHYLYRPKYVEKYAKELFDSLPTPKQVPDEIRKLIGELQTEINPDYNIAKYLSKGILYLHGKVPGPLRDYLVESFRNSDFITHLVATSVVLAGVNLPIDTLYFVSGGANRAELKNLIGRVNRLNEVFNADDLRKLVVPVHFMEISDYPQKGGRRTQLRNIVKALRAKDKDEVKNPILDKVTVIGENRNAAGEIVREEQAYLTQFSSTDIYAKLNKSGLMQQMNYTTSGVEKIKQNIRNNEGHDSEGVLINAYNIFFAGMEYGIDFKPGRNIVRLQNIEAINYYAMIKSDSVNLSLKQRVNKMLRYWETKFDDFLIYTDTAFGEVAWQPTDSNRGNASERYVRYGDHKTDANYLVNLAIVKLQVDQDFLDYQVATLVTALSDLSIITDEDFNDFMYGESDSLGVLLIQSGMSPYIFKMLSKDDQIKNIYINDNGRISAREPLIEYIKNQTGLKQFELWNAFK